MNNNIVTEIFYTDKEKVNNFEFCDRIFKTLDGADLLNSRIFAYRNGQSILGLILIKPTISNGFEVVYSSYKKKDRHAAKALLETALMIILKDKSNSTISIRTDNSLSDKFLTEFGFQKNGSEVYSLVVTTDYKYKFFLRKLKEEYNKSIVLNPTENIPLNSEEIADTSFLESMYVSESIRSKNSEVAFGGRDTLASFFSAIKAEWRRLLNAKEIDLKTLSGLHAHLILLSSILRTGDSIMLLPVSGGGHYKTPGILKRLGAIVIDMALDNNNHCVDIEKTKELIHKYKPKYLFVDRSEGLVYEDFSWLNEFPNIYKIFDASQYLAQILVDNYPNPFDNGFDMIVSSLHKNYPGPQKALFASKNTFDEDFAWRLFRDGLSAFMSSVHPENVVKSLIPYIESEKLSFYVKESKACILALEEQLIERGIPVVRRKSSKYPALHLWIKCATQEDSYSFFEKLESIGLLVNYRLLPYDLGYGLRLGVTAAVRKGLRQHNIIALSNIISKIYKQDIVDANIIKEVKNLHKALLHN